METAQWSRQLVLDWAIYQCGDRALLVCFEFGLEVRAVALQVGRSTVRGHPGRRRGETSTGTGPEVAASAVAVARVTTCGG